MCQACLGTDLRAHRRGLWEPAQGLCCGDCSDPREIRRALRRVDRGRTDIYGRHTQKTATTPKRGRGPRRRPPAISPSASQTLSLPRMNRDGSSRAIERNSTYKHTTRKALGVRMAEMREGKLASLDEEARRGWLKPLTGGVKTAASAATRSSRRDGRRVQINHRSMRLELRERRQLKSALRASAAVVARLLDSAQPTAGSSARNGRGDDPTEERPSTSQQFPCPPPSCSPPRR